MEKIEQGGFVAIYRRMYSNPVFKDELEVSIFIYMVANAVWHREGMYVQKHRHSILVQRGQILISIESFAKKFRISRRQMLTFLDRLRAEGMIETTNAVIGLCVGIVNYNLYQTDHSATEMGVHKTENLGVHKTENLGVHKTENLGVHKTENNTLENNVIKISEENLGVHKTENLGVHKTENLGVHKTGVSERAPYKDKQLKKEKNITKKEKSFSQPVVDIFGEPINPTPAEKKKSGKPKPAATIYFWAGDVIKLNESDFRSWQGTFTLLANFERELRDLDQTLNHLINAGDLDRKKWFPVAHRLLFKRQKLVATSAMRKHMQSNGVSTGKAPAIGSPGYDQWCIENGWPAEFDIYGKTPIKPAKQLPSSTDD